MLLQREQHDVWKVVARQLGHMVLVMPVQHGRDGEAPPIGQAQREECVRVVVVRPAAAVLGHAEARVGQHLWRGTARRWGAAVLRRSGAAESAP